MNIERKKFEREIAGRALSIETSRIAEQANAAVIATYGGTSVLVTVTMGKKEEDKDYLPLMVDYEEKFYAVGKILGSRFMRREGKASDEAVLSGRIVDRTIRPLFDQRIRRTIQVVNTVLSYDGENDPDFVALFGASTALSISDIPWNGPVGGVSVAKIDGQYVLNPTVKELAGNVSFDTFIAGTAGKINMVELGGNEAQEADVVVAFAKGQTVIDEMISFQKEIVAKIGKQKTEVKIALPKDELVQEVKSFVKDTLETALYIKEKKERDERMRVLEIALQNHLKEKGFDEKNLEQSVAVLDEIINDVVHENVLKSDRRVDGRKMDEVRDLYAEVDTLPRAHGSALFIRGNTQSLGVVTLGAPDTRKLVETMRTDEKQRFMLHYNFPSYSTGETGSSRGPGRREIGHGALAQKALAPLLPDVAIFPYTIRLVSEILSSNGSSSMATVCAGSLALMAAGVPMKRPVAGIAMGIIIGANNVYKILTDIQGPEDHYGDMDFKVAGTSEGVTAIQMDVKVDGVTVQMLEKGIAQAKEARLHILTVCNGALSTPRPNVSEFAPVIMTISIDPEKIGDVIGSGGKVINGIIENCKATAIDIEEDGTVFITAPNRESAEKARKEVEMIVRELQVGEILEGEVVKILEFGAIVEFGGEKSGMIHVSELKDGFVRQVTDVVKVGDRVKVKVLKVENGKTSLSMKAVKAI